MAPQNLCTVKLTVLPPLENKQRQSSVAGFTDPLTLSAVCLNLHDSAVNMKTDCLVNKSLFSEHCTLLTNIGGGAVVQW